MANKHKNKNKNKGAANLRAVPQQHPPQQQVQFIPYNAAIHRSLLPFQPGQTMIIGGVGLRIIQCFPNGDFILRPEAVQGASPSIILPRPIDREVEPEVPEPDTTKDEDKPS